MPVDERPAIPPHRRTLLSSDVLLNGPGPSELIQQHLFFYGNKWSSLCRQQLHPVLLIWYPCLELPKSNESNSENNHESSFNNIEDCNDCDANRTGLRRSFQATSVLIFCLFNIPDERALIKHSEENVEQIGVLH
jgi:hypothetical protein